MRMAGTSIDRPCASASPRAAPAATSASVRRPTSVGLAASPSRWMKNTFGAVPVARIGGFADPDQHAGAQQAAVAGGEACSGRRHAP